MHPRQLVDELTVLDILDRWKLAGNRTARGKKAQRRYEAELNRLGFQLVTNGDSAYITDARHESEARR